VWFWPLFFSVLLLFACDINISWSLYVIGLLLSAILGILFMVKIVLEITPEIKDAPEVPQLLEALHALLNEDLDINDKKKCDAVQAVAPVFSRNVDHEVGDILNKLIRDYVMTWLAELLADAYLIKDVEAKIKRDSWIALKKLNERLCNIDKVQLLASDIIQRTTEHFSRLRISTQEALAGVASKDAHDIVVNFQVPVYNFLHSHIHYEVEFILKLLKNQGL